MTINHILAKSTTVFSLVLPERFFSGKIHKFDFTKNNPELAGLDVTDLAAFTRFVDSTLAKAGAVLGVGGYGEDRVLYQSKLFLSGEESRSVHLAVDLWVPAGTGVYTPSAGRIHSFQDNNNYLDYGPTIILEHEIGDEKFYSLYGHLSRASLTDLKVGREFAVGERVAWIGDPTENGTWPPHLHFQLITDMLGQHGDFPGVAKPSEAAKYLAICPDPNLILRLKQLEN